MRLAFALILGLSLSFTPAALADTVVNPGGDWWANFFKAVDGISPNYEAIARGDPEYLAADEFTRAEVMERIIDRLKAEQAALDVTGTEVRMSISTQLGDYSTAQGGFPVEMFGQNMGVRPGYPASADVFFRNWQDFVLYAATVEEGRALRERIGKQPIRADVRLGDIRPSATRERAYDARVLSVSYYAQDGLLLATVDAPAEAMVVASEAIAMVDTVRRKILDLADIPPLGTTWDAARLPLAEAYPQVASDLFIYPPDGKTLAFVTDNGRILVDAPHDPDKPFLVFLQQVDGPWRSRHGFSMDMSFSPDALDTKGTGPGFACHTPEVRDRCAVLEFSPSDDGHVLTRAYGVVELEPTEPARAMLDTVIGEGAVAFDIFSAPIDSDTETMKLGALAKFPGTGSVIAHAAGAGASRPGEPLFDPLKNTRGVKPITREIALFAVEGSASRVPLIFVLQ